MALRTTLARILEIFLWCNCTLGALLFVDISLYRFFRHDLPRVYQFAKLPTRHLGQSWPGPGVVTGALHGPPQRQTPSREPSALWTAWITHTRRSGRNTITDIVCTRGVFDGLSLSQGGLSAQVTLYAKLEDLFLLKEGPMQTIPAKAVLSDLGEVQHGKHIPDEMRESCSGPFPRTGTLEYHEASIPPGGRVTLAACQQGEALERCDLRLTGLSARGFGTLVRARANEALDMVRFAGISVLVALNLLAGALLKLRVPPAPAAAPPVDDEKKGKA